MAQQRVVAQDDGGSDEDDVYDERRGFLQYHGASQQQQAIEGRSSFIPKIASPGPAAYTPQMESIKNQAPRAPFGTSKRDNESHRYISQLHNLAVPPADTPGPGTYRVAKADHYPHSPKNMAGPSWRFGTGAQRHDPASTSATPGPIYNQDPGMSSISYSFAPQGNIDIGMTRSRADNSMVFLSKSHAEADRTIVAMDMAGVGPGLYETVPNETLSPKRRAATVVFGKSNRDAKDSLHTLQMAHAPLATTAAATPGAIYDVRSSLEEKPTLKFGKGPRCYSPELGGGKAGPYLSRLHEHSMRGATSPGPATYDVRQEYGASRTVGGLGDSPAYGFGTASSERSPIRGLHVPGPGAYTPKDDTLSRAVTAPAFSLAPNLRTDFTAPNAANQPGPGAYNVSDAARQEGKA